jgi:hypothetical protein
LRNLGAGLGHPRQPNSLGHSKTLLGRSGAIIGAAATNQHHPAFKRNAMLASLLERTGGGAPYIAARLCWLVTQRGAMVIGPL